jgi:hypothetical protein
LAWKKSVVPGPGSGLGACTNRWAKAKGDVNGAADGGGPRSVCFAKGTTHLLTPDTPLAQQLIESRPPSTGQELICGLTPSLLAAALAARRMPVGWPQAGLLGALGQ